MFTPSFTDKIGMQMDAQGVAEAEDNQANRNVGNLSSQLTQAGAGITDYIAQDKKTEAEKLLKETGVKELQAMFDSVGMKTKANAFRNNIESGLKFYMKHVEQAQKKGEEVDSSKIMAQIFSKGRTRGVDSEKEILIDNPSLWRNEVTGIQEGETGYEGPGQVKATKLHTETKDITWQEALQEVSQQEGMNIDSLKSHHYKAIQEFFGAKDAEGGEPGEAGMTDKAVKELYQAKETKASHLEKQRIREQTLASNMPIDKSKHESLTTKLISLESQYDDAVKGSLPVIAITNELADGKNKTGVADIALIFKFMNALDPKSVVREAEFDAAARAGGYIDGMAGFLNNIIQGQMLPKKAMQEMVRFMSQVHNETVKSSIARKSKYKNFINQTYYGNNGANKVENILNGFIKTPKQIEYKKVNKAISKSDRFDVADVGAASDKMQQWAKDLAAKWEIPFTEPTEKPAADTTTITDLDILLKVK